MLHSVVARPPILNARLRHKLVLLEHTGRVFSRPQHPPSAPPSAPPTAAALPAYQLYGEQARPQGHEPWHLETIWSRSRLHDWEIQPHRHEGFQQFLHIAQGRAEAWLDGRLAPLVGPCVVSVPPLAAHGFRFEPQVQGHVLTVQAQHLNQLLGHPLGGPANPTRQPSASQPDPELAARLAQPAHLSLQRQGALARQLHSQLAELAEEYTGHAAWRAQALDAALLRWVLNLARALPAGGAAPTAARDSRAADHLVRYRALVESRFRLQPRVADLAAELGLTATQLNRVCRATVGQSALALLHARMLLEAQRQLAYTRQSIKQIGLDLGFADPAYFSRFFQRGSGLGPAAWREASHALATGQRPAEPPAASAAPTD